LTQAAHEEEIHTPKKDFVQYFIQDRKINKRPFDWKEYHGHLVAPYKMLKEFERYGFAFEDACTSTRFQDILKNSKVQYIIFFSHCLHNGTPQECIEFYDRLVPSEEIFSWLPRETRRVYDFAVCSCLYLCGKASEIKREYVIGTSGKAIKLGPWLTIFSETFSHMVVSDMDYINAFDYTVKGIEERIKKMKKK
jgi:hypothetical protein